jgi:hypothetical protein
MATLTTQIFEIITIGDNKKNASYTNTINNVNYTDSRVMSVQTGSLTGIVSFDSTTNTGTFPTGSFVYGRFSNVGNTYIQLYVSSSTNDTSFLLSPGGSYMLSTTEIAQNPTSSFTFTNIVDVKAVSSGSSGTLEYFIATT